KKNDSVTELNKTNAQMLKLLSELGLDASKVEKLGDEGDDV
ncbi:P27 family phage terminase small subunit, partial [Bacillus sp. Hm123]